MSADWLDTARADLARIFAFNLERSAAFAERVDTRLLERADALEKTPMMGRPFGRGGLRYLSIVDIQYVMTYARVGDRVVIVRIHHARENREAP